MANIVAGRPIINSTQYVVDDLSPLISCKGRWELGGVSAEHNGTTHGLTGPGSVRFSFQGTSIAAYGTLTEKRLDCQVLYKLDGTIMSTHTLLTVNLAGSANIYGVQYFLTPQLAADTHTFEIIIGPCSGPSIYAGAYWLDYFVIQSIAKSRASPCGYRWMR